MRLTRALVAETETFHSQNCTAVAGAGRRCRTVFSNGCAALVARPPLTRWSSKSATRMGGPSYSAPFGLSPWRDADENRTLAQSPSHCGGI